MADLIEVLGSYTLNAGREAWNANDAELAARIDAILASGSAVPTSRNLIAGSGLSGGGSLAADRTFAVGQGDGITVSADAVAVDGTVVRNTRQIIGGNGLLGTSTLANDVTLHVGAGDGISVAENAVSVDASVVRSTIEIVAGQGLTGGGALTGPSVTLNVVPGAGLDATDDSVLLDQSFAPTWTGEHAFQATITTRHVLPEATDTYDLGSSTRLFRKGWLSELDTILFAEQTVSVVGNAFMLAPDQGTLPVEAPSSTTPIDFGRPMTPGDFVLFRAAGAVEYVQVGALVSGTSYEVTRNLDGSGSNTWPAGAVFVVLGTTGDGRIELSSNATSPPKIQLLRQGATYNAQTEQLRLGDLNGNWGYTSETYGIALGEHAADKGNITLDPTNGLRLRIHTTDIMTFGTDGAARIAGELLLGSAGAIIAGDPLANHVLLDEDGLRAGPNVELVAEGIRVAGVNASAGDDGAAYIVRRQDADDGAVFGGLYPYYGPSVSHLELQVLGDASRTARSKLHAISTTAGKDAFCSISAKDQASDSGPYVQCHLDWEIDEFDVLFRTDNISLVLQQGQGAITLQGYNIDLDTTNGVRIGSTGTRWVRSGGYTAGAPAATGYVTLRIGSTDYKLLAATP